MCWCPQLQCLDVLIILVTEFSAAAKHEKISWNEKFSFDFRMSEWVNISHLKLRIMDEEYFTDGGFVGETMYEFLTQAWFYFILKLCLLVNAKNCWITINKSNQPTKRT